jgi:stearoyl-CoA desaturase (delta-9 desaturase)
LQFLLVCLALPAGTPIQWAGNHRQHHRFTDVPGDPHSPHVDGFWFAHVGWYIGTNNAFLCALYALGGPLRMVFDAWHRPRSNQESNKLAADLAATPHLAWLSRKDIFAMGCLIHFALPFSFCALIWGNGGVATWWLLLMIIYNLGDGVNSIGHLYGKKYFSDCRCQARDHWFLGILTFGDGWHHSHHAFPKSAKHGLQRGQVDLSYCFIKLLAALGLATDIALPAADAARRESAKVSA